jgi:transposase-like protein
VVRVVYRECKACGATFTQKPVDLRAGIRVPEDKAILALSLLVEGSSPRGASRVTGLSKNTIGKLVLRIGNRCNLLLLERTKGAKVEAVQLDEV